MKKTTKVILAVVFILVLVGIGLYFGLRSSKKKVYANFDYAGIKKGDYLGEYLEEYEDADGVWVRVTDNQNSTLMYLKSQVIVK